MVRGEEGCWERWSGGVGWHERRRVGQGNKVIAQGEGGAQTSVHSSGYHTSTFSPSSGQSPSFSLSEDTRKCKQNNFGWRLVDVGRNTRNKLKCDTHFRISSYTWKGERLLTNTTARGNDDHLKQWEWSSNTGLGEGGAKKCTRFGESECLTRVRVLKSRYLVGLWCTVRTSGIMRHSYAKVLYFLLQDESIFGFITMTRQHVLQTKEPAKPRQWERQKETGSRWGREIGWRRVTRDKWESKTWTERENGMDYCIQVVGEIETSSGRKRQETSIGREQKSLYR